MAKMSFIDKIGILFEMIASSKMYIIIFLVLLLIGYILTSRNRKKDKILKRICLIIYIIVFGIIIYTYRNNLGNMFDYMMNNFFIAVYFPNLAIYLAAIITTNIIMWISVFNNKIPRFIRNINVTIYCSMTYLMILTLNIIKVNNLDVFTQSSVYGNKNAQALIELSSTIFVVWIAFLILYKLIKPIFYKQPQKSSEIVKQQVQVVEQKVMTPLIPVRPIIDHQVSKKLIEEKPYREIEAPTIVFGNNNKTQREKLYQEVEVPAIVFGNNKVKIERSYHGIEAPSMVIGNNIKPKEENIYRGVSAPNMVIGNNIKTKAEKLYRKIEAPRVVTANKVKVEKVVQDTKIYDDLLTLDDYRLLLSILKEQKQKEQQEKERQARIDKEQAKFRELQQLYLNTNPTSF